MTEGGKAIYRLLNGSIGGDIIVSVLERDNRGRPVAVDARYQEALDYIYSFIDYEKQPRPRDAIHYDLRRMDELFARLGNPHLKAKTVHITGSKGKGSTAAMIASVLTTSGYTTGLYTSPHLYIFNERIRVDGKLITDQEIVTLVNKLKPEVTAVNEKATYGKLTTFEVITALGFLYFESKQVDYQVIEVGLGGRLDATNVVKPEVCIITSISLEHTDVLGNTLAEIATEKSGIIKPACVTVISPQADEAKQVIEKACRDIGVKLIQVGRDVTWQPLDFDIKQQSLKAKGRLGNYEVSIPLLGQYQLENAATAVAALEVLMEKDSRITKKSISKGLAQVSWPGRLQVLNRRPLIVADGAHNPYSAGKLREALKHYFNFEKAILIIGLSADKNVAGIISELAPLFDKVIATHSVHPRAMPTAALAAELKKQGVRAEETEDISVALPLALSMTGRKDLICVTGSLFVAAGAIEQAPALGLRP
ncbi:MAG TPA: folylpolyglutamate synthase/dihydrofolate synthase family protein [Dehalococcoidales bacterium]|nr:folylpolyglutamate synthase/dihydrofolate synthase family protein [Dehalococcoidales bacterium]